jgi:hypothetical protein
LAKRQKLGRLDKNHSLAIATAINFLKLKGPLEHFSDEPMVGEDYTTAAELSNHYSVSGVQGSHTDFLFCAVAMRLEVEIFTTDKDFERYVLHLPIGLYGS